MSSIRPKSGLAVFAAVAAAAAPTACGTQEITVPSGSALHRGAVLFQERCAGCHTLAAAGANGSAANVRNGRGRNQGPNFNVRKESYQRVLYAIENGGFSGAIMPQNIFTGADAKLVAQFVAKYAGADVNTPPSPGMSGGSSTAAPKANAQAGSTDLATLGAQVFAQNGCGACHTLAAAGANGKAGPNLAGVGGDPAAAIKQSIVNPNAVITAGYAANVMPQQYGKLLTAQQINALVAYLQKVAK